MEIDIQSIAEEIVDELQHQDKISIDDISWESLLAVDEIKCAIFDKVYDILISKDITILE